MMLALGQGEADLQDPINLYRILVKHFDKPELEELCFELGVEYYDLPGETRSAKARELVQYLQRRHRIPELVVNIERSRPEISSDATSEPPSQVPGQYSALISSPIPYRKSVLREYVGERHKPFGQALKDHNVVGIWGRSGCGKTWVAAKIALDWQDASDANNRPVMWFECQRGTGFHDLVFGIANYLGKQGEESFWHWLQIRPDRVPSPAKVIGRLTELLNRGQYLLCLDNYHYFSGNQDIQSLVNDLEAKLDETATKVILIGRRRPQIPRIGGGRLKAITAADIRRLILVLKGDDNEWLNETIAGEFAKRLVRLYGTNLTLLSIVINWPQRYATQAEVEEYLASLGEDQIAEQVLVHGDDVQAAVLTVLSILDGWEDRSTLTEMAQGYGEGIKEEGSSHAIDLLLDVKLVEERDEKYRLSSTVREFFQERLAERGEDLSELYHHIADIYSTKGDLLLATDHYLRAKVFPKAIYLLAEHTIQITRAGGGERALKQLEEIRRAVATNGLTLREALWERILTGDLKAWLGRLAAAQKAAQDGLKGLAKIPQDMRSEYKYEEGRLKARLGALLAERGELVKAMRHLDESKTLMEEYGWEQGIQARASRVQPLLMVLNDLGLAHRLFAHKLKEPDRVSSFNDAIQSYRQCTVESESYEGVPYIDYAAARASVGLGQVYDDRNEEGDQDLAIKAVQDGLDGFQAIEHQWGIGYANRTLGTIYFRQGDHKMALKFHQQGLAAAEKCDDRQGIIVANAAIAEIYIAERRLMDAEKFLTAAKVVLEKAQIPFLLDAVSLVERWAKGIKLRQDGKPGEGEQVLRKVLREFRSRDPDFAAEALLVERDLEEFGSSTPRGQSMTEWSSMSDYNTDVIRTLLSAAFGDEEFDTFCYDHFRLVYEGFSRGMTRGEKIQLLIAYCERHRQFEQLFNLIERYNPNQYQHYEPQLR